MSAFLLVVRNSALPYSEVVGLLKPSSSSSILSSLDEGLIKENILNKNQCLKKSIKTSLFYKWVVLLWCYKQNEELHLLETIKTDLEETVYISF